MLNWKQMIVAVVFGGLLGWGVKEMSQKKIFISFDYDNDKQYRYLLAALSKNSGSEISFEDITPGEIQSYDIGKIKGVLTNKIRNATHTLVIVGEHANSNHPDRVKIGEKNWQHWEIKKSAEEKKGFIAVKIKNANASPPPLMNQGAAWAHSFNVEAILKAINAA